MLLFLDHVLLALPVAHVAMLLVKLQHVVVLRIVKGLMHLHRYWLVLLLLIVRLNGEKLLLCDVVRIEVVIVVIPAHQHTPICSTIGSALVVP